MPYVVVEKSGMDGEVDAAKFEDLEYAKEYIDTYYKDGDVEDLPVRIAWEDENGRTYEW